jgi:FtsP/CotA-like multicopper oxidase with cupredoxin domain
MTMVRVEATGRRVVEMRLFPHCTPCQRGWQRLERGLRLLHDATRARRPEMARMTRRQLLKYGAAGGAVLFLPLRVGTRQALAQVPGGTLPPGSIPKYMTPLVIPPAMPRTAKVPVPGAKSVDYYEIAVRQFEQHILPESMDLEPTTVWSYGSANHPSSFNYPAFTVEATSRKPVRVKWINELVDANGNYLPHLVPVDQTVHWANPPGGIGGRDGHGMDPTRYMGPVPIVTHLHGGHSSEESDGYAEAWYLPAANNIPSGFARVGSFYETFRLKAEAQLGQPWTNGTAVFEYDNDQRAATMWYHDHTLGMTRANVYAGPAGFYLLRGGPTDAVGGRLPGPAPALGDRAGTRYYEIPIAIQDRSFNADGSLFYPDNRAFFEGLDPSQLQIPFIPEDACDGPSDISPIFNPEFFGNTIVVNGKTWPFLEVEQRRYRFRFLNGCNSRFLLLELSNGLPFWQIGTEGGFLPAPLELERLLLGPAERADVIVDFTNAAVGTEIILQNLGPDEPFGGGEPPGDFDAADPETTGQVMQFRVVPATGPDTSTPPDRLLLPRIAPLPAPSVSRQVSLNEVDSETVLVSTDADGNVVLDCEGGEPFGPKEALLGTLAGGAGVPLGWYDPITENPAVGATEVWEMHNFTEDAHPIHIHEILFEVVNREVIETGAVRAPEPWESGSRKDTVIAYPGEITRVKATYDRAGLFVWHCHIVEHEDHEMMRPYRIRP